MNSLERYYEKFDEEKRLTRRHGQVEFFVTWNFLQKYLKQFNNPKIADIGAGTGAYSVPLGEQGYDVTAVEYVKSNLQKLRAKRKNIKTFLGDAKKLDMFADNTFDFLILLGPMYHALNRQDKINILSEAKRITKNQGIIFVAYYMNDYAIIKHGFVEGNILNEYQNGNIDKDFHTLSQENDLYSFDRISDINFYNHSAGLERMTIFAPDGASDYIRDVLNKMDEKTFELFKHYQLTIAENLNLIGASSHVVDVLKVCK